MFKVLLLLSVIVVAAISNTNGASKRQATADKQKQAYSLYQQIYKPKPPTGTSTRKKHPPLPPATTTQCKKGRSCSLFVPENREYATYVAKQMIAAPTFEDFIDISSDYRETTSEDLFLFSYTTALIAREDTQYIPLPPPEEFNPYWYLPSTVIEEANNYSTGTDSDQPNYVDYKFEVTLNSTEHLLAYFREDILIGALHWIWHVLFNGGVAINELNDRHGEIFSYFHHQITVRYDAERISCGLPRTVPLTNFNTPIVENYSPTLLSSISGDYYHSRDKNTVLVDVIDPTIIISQQETYLQRVVNISSTRRVVTSNGTITLTQPKGIDILGSILESNSASPNIRFYGSIHNYWHVAISRCTNPNETSTSEGPPIGGVIGYPNVAMRDPAFYPLHKLVDSIFATYKSGVPRYTKNDLLLSNVAVLSVSVKGASKANTLQTYFQRRIANISRGISFSGTKPIVLRVKHLNHEQFNHSIFVQNKLSTDLPVTVRIFIAPKKDHLNKGIPFSEQQRMFICLDVFSYTLKPGNQTILRRAEDSSVTVNTQQGFDQLEKTLTDSQNAPADQVPIYCICGWPDSHLIPKGTTTGMSFTYFVMLSSGADYQEPRSQKCSSAPNYCGVWNGKYPDKRNMGYPFDLSIDPNITSPAAFVTSYPNMKIADVIIKHLPTKVVETPN